MLLHVHHNESAAVFVVRVLLGMLFFFQGWDAVFGIKVRGVIETFSTTLSEKKFPKFLLVFGAYFTSYVELTCGFLLIIGFVKYYSLYLLGLDLLLASFAFGLMKPMWDMQFVFSRLVLLIFLLVVPSEWDVFSVDYVWSLFKFLHSIT